jgi:hypothetical protein
MHHMHCVLDETYGPLLDFTSADSRKCSTSFIKEHLKTNKGKSLVSQFQSTHDVQSIYRELKKCASSSSVFQLSIDILLQYITNV